MLDPVEVALEAEAVRIGLLGAGARARADRPGRAGRERRVERVPRAPRAAARARPTNAVRARDARCRTIAEPSASIRSCTIRGYRPGVTPTRHAAEAAQGFGLAVPALHPAFDPAERLEADLRVHAVRVAGAEHEPRRACRTTRRRTASGTRRRPCPRWPSSTNTSATQPNDDVVGQHAREADHARPLGSCTHAEARRQRRSRAPAASRVRPCAQYDSSERNRCTTSRSTRAGSVVTT